MKIIDGKPISARKHLELLWNMGSYRKALKLAASWPRLGEHKNAIQAGWAAASNARFYAGLGKDPQALYATGLEAVAARYNLPAPTEADL